MNDVFSSDWGGKWKEKKSFWADDAGDWLLGAHKKVSQIGT